MSKARLRTPLLGAVVAALTAGALILGGAGAADAKDSQARTANDQEQLLDPQAPIGTEAKSAKAATATTQVDSPVKTTATDPDSKSDLQQLADTGGGEWTDLLPLDAGTNAYHMIMGPGGKILLIAGSGNSSDVFEAGTFKAYIWKPDTPKPREIDVPTDMFCAGHMLMSNGDAIAAGGTKKYRTSSSPWEGSKKLYTFDFDQEEFIAKNMASGRWYPSVVNTRGGYALIIGGFNGSGANSKTSEVYRPWDGSFNPAPGNREFPLYPHIFLTSKAKYFFTGEGWTKPSEDVDSSSDYFHPGFWDPFNGNKFTKVNDLTVPTRRGYGTSCWLGSIRRQKLMVMGGGWPATSSTNVIDLDSSSTPKYKAGPSLRAAKAYLSCVQLPDGSVLELGGGSANKIENASQEVSLLKSPSATSWTAMNPLPKGEHRLYHSMAYLADDGSVITLSSNPKGQARSNTVLKFKPPYMFQKSPTLSKVPDEIEYGKTYPIEASSDVTRVIMMTAPSPTHGFDANQREVPVQYADGKITINATSSLAPRGYYRIFVINADGGVSSAKWTRLK